MAFQR